MLHNYANYIQISLFHIHEYVNYSNFVVKYQIIFIIFFFIITVCVLKSFKQFVMIKHHFQLTDICFGQSQYP